nr:methylated-DNA--[protein]-cysteine S-methyltransferase [uncultured Noviherbaspirillum sp.]
MIHYHMHESPLGSLLLAASARGLCGLYFAEHRHFKGPQGWLASEDHPYLLRAAGQLDDYFAGRRQTFDLPLDLAGTPFQRKVWQQLMHVPYGATTSYLLHAQAAGAGHAVRAVGTAIGRNPLSIVIPCHRVVAGDGALAGYAGGLERKRYLLAFEAAGLDAMAA